MMQFQLGDIREQHYRDPDIPASVRLKEDLLNAREIRKYRVRSLSRSRCLALPSSILTMDSRLRSKRKRSDCIQTIPFP